MYTENPSQLSGACGTQSGGRCAHSFGIRAFTGSFTSCVPGLLLMLGTVVTWLGSPRAKEMSELTEQLVWVGNEPLSSETYLFSEFKISSSTSSSSADSSTTHHEVFEENRPSPVVLPKAHICRMWEMCQFTSGMG